MKTNHISRIRYTKATNHGSGQLGEQSERYILPTSIPSDNVRGFDVTQLSEGETKHLRDLWEQYQEYYQAKLSTIFSFEDWVEHTQPDSDIHSLALWRTFKQRNIEPLD